MSDGPFDTTFQVGEIVDAEPFEEARTEALVKLEINLGEEIVHSAAQLGFNYEIDELPGRQVLCATNLGTVQIADFTSEALTIGVPDEDGNPVLVAPDSAVPLGGELY
ncbi:tRNA-binding protein [Salinarchaeum laminariae]|uniref:tRNA-binding protein n=1 Tax=Salinarchaeum laminariae TaxID=869888 RepID=UPI0020BE7566|nr:tRNA-binding protein [Salinarchaeum laminariae]